MCRQLAGDAFLPSFFAERGRRLVFSSGIIVLAILSGILLIVFRGVTDKLIPLFAIGAFSAFAFSQIGMVGHWQRKKGRAARTKLVINAIGAVTTSVALVIIVFAKFLEGAWIILVVGPGAVWLFWKIKRHYEFIAREVEQPVKLQTGKPRPPVVIIPIDSWNRVTERALHFGLEMSDDITALHVARGEESDSKSLLETWGDKVEKPARAANAVVPRLQIIHSPYRQIYEPILKICAEERRGKQRPHHRGRNSRACRTALVRTVAPQHPRRGLASTAVPARRPAHCDDYDAVVSAGLGLPCHALDFIQGRWVFQGRCVAEFFAQIRSAHNAAHHFRVPRFWYVSHKNHVARSERLTEIACHILFQFGRKSDIAVRSLLQNAKTN